VLMGFSFEGGRLHAPVCQICMSVFLQVKQNMDVRISRLEEAEYSN
jgi:hypothetical protein